MKSQSRQSKLRRDIRDIKRNRDESGDLRNYNYIGRVSKNHPTMKYPEILLICLIGEDVRETSITYDDYASWKNRPGEEIGTSGSAGLR